MIENTKSNREQDVITKREDLIPERYPNLWKALDTWTRSYNSLSDSSSTH